jgi:hypothetical protein
MLIALLIAASLQVAVEPDKIQLGTDDRARVVVRLPAGAKGLRLSASTGSLRPVREEAPGVFAAEYTPPDETVPQVAIFTAVAELDGQPVVAFARLPLWGQGDAVVKTRKFAAIQVRIGDQVFGPVKAGRDGIALVPVVVPPGVFEAKHGQRSIDLRLPPVPRLQISLGRASLRADRAGEVAVFVVAVTASGQPAAKADFALRADRGQLSPAGAVSPGLWKASWRLPPGKVGVSRVAATLDGLDASTDLQLVPGPAAAIALTADRDRLPAGEAVLSARATAVDAAGNASDEDLQFSADPGALESHPDGRGAWKLRVSVPASFEGRSALRIAATGAEARAALELPLVPGEPAAATIEPVLPARADGWTPVRLRVAIADRFGNPVADASPMAQADRGAVREVQADSRGVYLATYVPPLSREGGTAIVSIQAGAARARSKVPLLPHIPFVAVSPKLGYTSNFADLQSPLFGVEAAVRTDRFGPQLALVAELDWWFATASDSVATSAASTTAVRARSDFIAASLALGWQFRLLERVRGFLSAGPTITHLWSHVRVSGQPTTYDTATVPGAQISFGVERRMWRGLPFVEARWSFAKDPGLQGVLTGPMRAFSFSAGWRFEML